MPPESKCPLCADVVPDWHFEWHSRQDQQTIIAAEKAMQCPLCGAGVAFDGFVLTRSDQPTAQRDIQQAARWARLQNKSLSDYLQTREGQPYSRFWSEPEVRAADIWAAAQPQ